jgi:hypothetical protein
VKRDLTMRVSSTNYESQIAEDRWFSAVTTVQCTYALSLKTAYAYYASGDRIVNLAPPFNEESFAGTANVTLGTSSRSSRASSLPIAYIDQSGTFDVQVFASSPSGELFCCCFFF